MSFPLPPGGLFPLTTAPTGRNAGGQYPLSAVLSDAIRSLAPTAYWKLDEASGNLADAMSGGYTATVTGSSPTYGVAAPSPIGRGVTFSGTGQYATTATTVPTPTSSISVFAIVSTSDATAASRSIISRGAASQYSWDLRISSTHAFQFVASQSTSAGHAAATVGSSVNDGSLYLVAGTFNGTTIIAYRGIIGASTFNSASSTSLTGSWHTASSAGVQIAARADVQLLPGTVYLAGLVNRVLTETEFRWLHSIASGV